MIFGLKISFNFLAIWHASHILYFFEFDFRLTNNKIMIIMLIYNFKLACPNLLCHKELSFFNGRKIFYIFLFVLIIKIHGINFPILFAKNKGILLSLTLYIKHIFYSNITLFPLSQRWLILNKLCFKPSTSKILWILENSVHMSPWQVILPFLVVSIGDKSTIFGSVARKRWVITGRSCTSII